MNVYTAGVWDLFHEGHQNILRRSRRLADLGGDRGLLIVGVVTDFGAATYKPEKPRWNENRRLHEVLSWPGVDAAFLQPGTDPTPVLLGLNAIGATPACMSHGDDWTELREGMETLHRLGIRLELLPYTHGVSSTILRARATQPA